MSAPLVADIEDITRVLPCCRIRGSHIHAPLVADIEDLTLVLMFY